MLLTVFVVVGAVGIELRGIGCGGPGNLGQSGHAGLRTRRVIEQHTVADLHLVAHEVARLVVAHTGPGQGLLGRLCQVVDRGLVGLALHQPMTGHGAGREHRK